MLVKSLRNARALVHWLVGYSILSRLLYLAYSANLGLLCMPHPGMGSLSLTSIPKEG